MSALKLSFIIEAIDRATAPLRKVNERMDKITEPVSRVRASFNALLRESHLPRLATQAAEISKRFDGVVGSLRGIAGAALIVAGAGAAMWFPLKGVIDQGSKIGDTANMLGVSAREFQRVAYALTLDGSSAEDAAAALRFLQNNAVQAMNGSKELQKSFERLGMSATFVAENLNNPIALLHGVADGMQKLPTQADRIAASQTLMSRSGARLVQTLSEGSDGLKRTGDEAEALGTVLDDNTVAAMKNAGDQIMRMHKVLGGVMALISSAALPVVQKITAGVITWALANRELIASRVAEFAERLIQRLPEIAETTLRVVGAIGTLIVVADRIVQALGGVETIVAVVAGILIGKLVVAVVSLGSAIVGLMPIIASFGAVLMATPLGWFLGAIAAIAGAAYLVYKHWEPIKQFFVDLWDGVKNAILQLDAITPDWVKRFTLPGAALSVAANAVRPGAAASALAAPGSTDVGGTLRIAIDQDGRARVAQLESNNPNVDYDVDAGLMGVAP